MNFIQEIQLDENQQRWKDKAIKSIKKYQQGALYLATGMGKSYVAKDIVNNYLKADPNAQILWIAPASAMQNVKMNFFSTYESIVFESFENLRTREDSIDEHEFDNLKLIIIDEAHKALANKTWISINYILEKYTDRRNREEYKRAKKNKADLLVLTASGVRSCDSVKVFEQLTNRLEEHVDYEVVDLQEAIGQDLLGKIHFLNSNISKYELMADSIINQLSAVELNESFTKKKEEIQSILDYILEYKENMFNYLGNDIHNKIKDIYDASNGDQWIVFYSRVKDAMSSTEFIEKLFKEIYKHNPKVKINIFQYHNGVTEEEINIANKSMYNKPDENTVNVYITVNKGITSIHPENVVGEILFRSTYSQNLYEQSIGRVTKNKKHSNREVFVVDVVDNANRVLKDGYNTSVILRKIESIEKTENELVDKLKEDFLNNIDFENINNEFDKIMLEFNKLKDLGDISEMVTKIADIIDKEAGKDYKFTVDKSPYSLLAYSKLLSSDEAMRLTTGLKTIQSKFINGEFGKHTYDTLDEATPLYKLIYDKLGYLCFVTPESVKDLTKYKELIEMANKVKYGKQCVGYKDKLNKLRIEYIKGDMTDNVVEFCKFNKINLRGNGEDLIRLAVDTGVLKNINILKQYSDLSKRLAKVENGTEEDFNKAFAMYYYLNSKYFSTILMRAINLSYECIDDFNKINLSEHTKTWINSLEFIYKTDRIGTSDEVEKSKRHINIGTADLELAKLALYVETNRNFTPIEVELFKLYNINIDAINKNIVADKIMDLTSISNIIYRIENENKENYDISSYIRDFKSININRMPSKWTAKIKEIIDNYENQSVDEDVTREEVLDKCREKLNILCEAEEVKVSEFDQLKRLYKRASKLNISNECLISTCFPTIYIDNLIPAFERMKTGSMTFDDFLVVNGTIEMGDDYIGKLAILLKLEIISSDYNEMAKKLISKQLEFK